MLDLSNFIRPKELLAMKQEVVEDTLAMANPIVAMEYVDGICMIAVNPSISLHKTSELYDKIAFAGTGVFNDYERLRKSGVHMADVKGFMYSREDVKAKSIASEYSTALGDIFVRQPMPLEVEILVAEIGKTPDDNRLYSIPFSGGLIEEQRFTVIGDYVKDDKELRKGLIRKYLAGKYPEDAEPSLKDAINMAIEAIVAVLGSTQRHKTVGLEIVTLDRTIERERKFHRLTVDEIAAVLA